VTQNVQMMYSFHYYVHYYVNYMTPTSCLEVQVIYGLPHFQRSPFKHNRIDSPGPASVIHVGGADQDCDCEYNVPYIFIEKVLLFF